MFCAVVMSHLLLVLVSLSACISCYASRFAIKVNGGENEARAIALKYGYSFEGQVSLSSSCSAC